MTDKVVQFEPFKDAKNWDDEYLKFLDVVNQALGHKNDFISLAKRLYFALKLLDNTSKIFWVLSRISPSMDMTEIKRGKKYMANWLEDILQELKES